MAKPPKTSFICQACGAVHNRWSGKCDSCGEWNTIVEENPLAGIGGGPSGLRSARKGRVVALTTVFGEIEDAPRIRSGIAELDRVTGGGFVRGGHGAVARHVIFDLLGGMLGQGGRGHDGGHRKQNKQLLHAFHLVFNSWVTSTR